MLRAVLRAALLAFGSLLLCVASVRAQTPSPGWTTLIPAGQYRTLAWVQATPGDALFLYLLQPVSAPAARIFTADVVDLGVRERDDVLREIASRHARAIAAHDVLAEPIKTGTDVAAYVIRHREVGQTAVLDGGRNLTLYVRSPARAEASGGGAGGM